MSKIKVRYYKEMCIGCGACYLACPKFWEMGSDSRARLKGILESTFDITTIPDIKCNSRAAAGCPMDAITISDEKDKRLSHNAVVECLAAMGDRDSIKEVKQRDKIKKMLEKNRQIREKIESRLTREEMRLREKAVLIGFRSATKINEETNAFMIREIMAESDLKQIKRILTPMEYRRFLKVYFQINQNK